jgi:hypothetical protein
MRRVFILALLIGLLPSTAFATSIVVRWTGPAQWYNNDWLSLCQQTGTACEFWNELQSYGISLNGPVSNTPLAFSMTFRDTMSDALGVYHTTADIHLQFGGLSLASYNQQVLLGNGFGAFSNGSFGLTTRFDPAATPAFAGYGRPPDGISLSNFGFNATPNSSLAAALLQPLPALTSSYCISLGGDCDLIGRLTAVSVQVPELPSLFLMLAAGLGALARYRRGSGRDRLSPD